ncbi:uncharacterized protein LOC130683087 [Manis pentadactyla]|uniref:uncharacterized protein LOC130683087 n=1 Tax=Manis pentadactyla TaxID=143292 RepID=UPI00255C5886|nr:uncharacterized protein LOC130683087 [Manis pentadactyla]
MKNNQPLQLRSKPNHPCHQFPNTPNPCPYTHTHTHISHKPLLLLHIPTPNTLPRHRSPFLRASTVTFADHPRRSPNFSAHTPSPPQTEGLPVWLVSLLHILPHSHPPHFLALASLPAPEEIAPTSYRSTPHSRTPSPRHSGLPASSPEAQPRHVGTGTPPHTPLKPARAGGTRVDRSLRRRSPGQCPQARFLRPLERRGRRFPGTHLEPVVNISPGFPSTNSSTRVLPSPPPTYLAAEDPPSSATPPPSARGPSRPPLTSAAELRVGAGRRAV